MKKYDHLQLEKKWQKFWEKKSMYRAKAGSKKKKFYSLVEFPYPSGDGLHVGHIRSYTALDIISRKRRMEGQEVLYPMGWDAFGLPTENYAIKTGIQPRIVTKKNTDNFRRQLKSLGFSFDWSREIDTTDPKYYKWTQWIFLQLYKQGLAYKDKMPINWCLSCKIGLANEEVIDGRCERCGSITEKREKEQWMLAITKYADRLHKDLDQVNYLERIKIQQRNWIGKSEGSEIVFKLENQNSTITVFTTRADTLFGATYVVLAPEHPLVAQLRSSIANWSDIQSYVQEAMKKSEIDRTTEGREKSGVELKGLKAINPANNEKLPIFIADYVLGNYGTGAIMAVPSHDERDYAFAKKFNLPIKRVIEPVFTQSTEPGKVKEGLPFEHRDAIIAIVKHWSEEKYMVLKWKEVAWGTFVTGGIEKGQTAEEAAKMEIREETGFLHPKLIADFGVIHGKFYHVPKQVNRFAHSQTLYFKLEDNVQEKVSEDEKKKHDVLWLSGKELRSFLTPDSHFRALDILNGLEVYTGNGLLTASGKFSGMESEEAKKKITEFVGGTTKTTYKLRDWVFSRQRYWGEPIPMIKCKDCGWVPVPEKDLPVKLPELKGGYKPSETGESPLAAISKWVNVKCPKCKGKALRETDTMPNWAGSSWYYLRYTDPKNSKELASKKALEYFTPVDWYNGGMEHTTLHLLYSRFWHKFLFDIGVVPTSEPYLKRTSHGLILAAGGEKMSKSKGNTVSPDELVKLLGADTLRLYEMFMGPFDQAIAWDTNSMAGSRRFIERIWKLQEKISPTAKTHTELESILNQTIEKVSDDIENLKMNTAVSTLMILSNEFEKYPAIGKEEYGILLRLLAPFIPHVTEELWLSIGKKGSVHQAPWPTFDRAKVQAALTTLAVQVSGKLRATIVLAPDVSQDIAENKARELPEVAKWLAGKAVRKVIYVPGKILNFVL